MAEFSRPQQVNLRRWWSDRLGGTEAPALFTWPELPEAVKAGIVAMVKAALAEPRENQ
jgi:hypothetical protein